MSDATGNLGSADLASILKREEQARRNGTGIQAAELQGEWSPQKLWSKGAKQESYSQAKLLQWLNARLSIRCAADADGVNLQVCNSVSLGPLRLRFKRARPAARQTTIALFSLRVADPGAERLIPVSTGTAQAKARTNSVLCLDRRSTRPMAAGQGARRRFGALAHRKSP